MSPETQPPSNRHRAEIPVRWGLMLLLGLPLIVLNSGWIACSEMRTTVTEITITTLFMGVTLILFVLTLGNQMVRHISAGRIALNQAELLTLYAMLSLGTAVAGIGNFGFFLPFLTNAFRFGEANEWTQWHRYLPAWVGPRDQEILTGFYEGNASAFRGEVLHAYALPVTLWIVFFLLLLGTTLCLTSIVRRRWTEEEHLPFPVIALPVELTRDRTPLLRDRRMWAGFALPFLLHSVNTIAGLYPTVPSFPINTSRQFLEGMPYPWTGLGSILILVHPVGVGFGYLVNTDVLFSMWFFYLVKKGLNLLGTVLNWRDPGPAEYGDGTAAFPFTGYQAWGAWLTIGIATIWAGWPDYRAYVKRALDGVTSPADHGEPLTPRQAVFGFVSGFAGLCGMVVALGAPLWIPVSFLGLYLLIMLALSRLEAETAVLSPLLAWVNPQSILTATLGTGTLSRTELAHIATLSWFNADYRAAAMPQQLQAMTAVQQAGVRRLSPLVGVLMLAGLCGMASSVGWGLHLYFTLGAATANVNGYRLIMGNLPWWNLQGWISEPRPPDLAAWIGMAAGAAITLLLTYLRTRVAGFPLSPAGYLLNMTWANELFWLDLFIAWAIKSLVLRYGGIRMYRATLPFFLGLILGDFVTGAAWSLFGAFTGLDLFRTFPN